MKIRIDAGISNRYSAVSNIQSAAGIAFLVLGFIFIDKEVGFPGKFAAVPVIGAVLLIAAGPEAWLNRVLMSNRLMVWIGLISFPLYLWHWPILTFARIVNGDVPDVSVRVAAVLLSIVLAWITYRFIERPIREGGDGNGKAYALVSAMVVMGP
ncbi:acyltransferase [Pseudomonas qingdaonensis]|nr:acyltransferase [Pseudomonas qingdaonensis]